MTPARNVRNLSVAGRQEIQQRGREEADERRLVEHAIQKDGGGIDGEQQTGDGAHIAEQRDSSRREQHARPRADHRLDEANKGRSVAEERIHGGEKVWIEWRLVEDVSTEPVAVRYPEGPLMVGLGVADSECEERRVRDLRDVDQADDERDRRHRQQ